MAAYAISGDINRVYLNYGGTAGTFGFPLSSENRANTSRWGTTGTLNLFEGGYIIKSGFGAFGIYGDFNRVYLNEGGTAGTLGFLKSKEETANKSRWGTTGTLYWFEQDNYIIKSRYGTFAIYGRVKDHYLKYGGT